MDLNYQTLIAVADDCPVTSAVVPPARGVKQTVTIIQHELLAKHPHRLTQEDLLFESWLRRQDLSADDRAELRARLFAKPQACLRSSPLPRKYGWGLLFDRDGRVALCPMESEEYQRLANGDGEVMVLKALRSSRAK